MMGKLNDTDKSNVVVVVVVVVVVFLIGISSLPMASLCISSLLCFSLGT